MGNQKNVICRPFVERGSCNFGDRCTFFHDFQYFYPNSICRIATPKTIPKGMPHGTPRGTPRGGAPEKDSKERRPKSLKPSSVAEVVEINAEPSEESSSSSEEEDSDSGSDGSLPTSKETESSSSSEWKVRGPSDNLIVVRSATHGFDALNTTVLKPKFDPVLDEIKGRITIGTGSGVHIVGRSNVHKKRHSMIRNDGQVPKLNTANGHWFHKLCQLRLPQFQTPHWSMCAW